MVLLAAVAAVMVAAHAGALGPLQCAEEERLLDERKRNGAKWLSKIPPQPLKKKRVWAADVGAAAHVAKMRQRRLDEGVTMSGTPRQKQSKKSRMVDSKRKPDADGLFATKKDVPPMRDPYFGLQIPLIRQDMLTAAEMLELRSISEMIHAHWSYHPTWRSCGGKRHNFKACLSNCQ